MSPQGEHRVHHWTRYWRAPRLASCGPADQVYAGPIANHWQAIFTGQLRNRQRLLDLCAGNGAIPLLAARAALDRGIALRIDAVDRAEIDPPRFLQLERPIARQIRFHANTDAAALPFPDDSFDWVVSQFGVEYAAFPAAIHEAMRVLRRGGRLHFVVHAAEGVLAAQASREREETRRLRAAALLGRTKEVLARVKQAADPAAAEMLINGLRLEAQRLAQSLGRPVNAEMVTHTINLCLHTAAVAPHFPLPVLQAKIDELAAELDAHARRLSDLLEAAVSKEKLKAWRAELQARGATAVSCKALHAGGNGPLIAWTLDARRPQG